MATVAELFTYPVKGCAGVRLTESTLHETGLPFDRAYLVVGPGGVFRSQRSDRSLAVIRPAADAEGVTLSAPGIGDLRAEIPEGVPASDVTMFGSPYRGVDQGDDAAAWLTEVLGVPSRLVRVPPDHGRVTDGRVAGTSAYADSCAVHAFSTASMAELNRRVGERGLGPLPPARFRPNILLEGIDEPHREDLAHTVRIGGAELAYAKLAVRCAVTMVDQVSGGKAGPEPLRTLAGYRRHPEGGVVFGAKFAVTKPGKVAVGDAFDVTAWGEAEL
ncbi:MOSC N-terminal beta barrel domain-containing protein [Phytomonospora sp. NPDC050363]|uniref:MOSC domain-containing protein n=1 Tax=Phytomonospora sp. NPDC050363 TaxID=3155642 RepID=UPI00340C28F7